MDQPFTSFTFVRLFSVVGFPHPFQDDENPNSVYIKTNERGVFESTSFEVIAEEMAICSTDTIHTALSCYISSFYVFNLAYIPRLQRTISFIQNFLLGIKDGTSVEKPVLTLASRLTKKSQH